MEPEFADLMPLFVSETRGRLERLAALAGRIETDAGAAAEARRELHTIKGAGRMLGLAVVSELCHGLEAALQAPGPGAGALLTRAVDALAAMVDAVARHQDPVFDERLARELGAGHEAPPAAAAGGVSSVREAVAPARGSGPVELRLDVATLEALADRATKVRILATGAGHLVDRLGELVRLAERGVGDRHPEHVLRGVAAALRRFAAELETGQRRLRRTAESQVELLQALQVQPLRPFLLSLARHARTLASSLGREVEVRIEGEDTRLDRGIAAELEEALLHLVRNAVDHGIESGEAREAAGKPRTGVVRLSASAHGARVRLTVADDGAGIDRAAVAKVAVAAGLLDPARAAAISSDELFRLLATPGFSTRLQATEVSGRGIGLDAVVAAVSRLGGDISLSSSPGAGTTVVVEVPAARRGDDVVVLRVGRVRLALPAGVLRRVTPLTAEAVIERDGYHLAAVGDRLVRFVPLALLCGETTEPRQLLIEGVAAGVGLALTVDDIEEQAEVLVLPPARSASVGPLLEGVALLPSGEPIAVLSPAALARPELGRTPAGAPSLAAPRKLHVLLVDDSPVTREMERRILEDAGFDVACAGDAGEALSYLGAEPFDCVVTDIEMPGMDGYELTRHLRGVPQLAHLPVVVVSTRERPEDRLRGLEAGADAYLTKQRLDPAELVALVGRLGGRR